MPRVFVVHWKPEEAGQVLDTLNKGGVTAELAGKDGPVALRSVREKQPDAIVIDLSRMPSLGREVAIELRKSAKTRHVPLVFVGGLPEKVSAIREQLPDAEYCECAGLVKAVRAAIKNKPDLPVQPTAMMDRYKGRTVSQKLGITSGTKVGVFEAPRDYRRILSSAPEDVEFQEDSASGCSLVLWFVREQHEVDARIRGMARHADKAKLWIIWPKGGNAKNGKPTETTIREAGLAAGLVDYKVCAVDEKWSGLLFARAKG